MMTDLEKAKPTRRRKNGVPAIISPRYPLYMQHPACTPEEPNRFPPVIVNDRDQELEYRSKGYELPGTPDPFAFITSNATEKADQAVSGAVDRVTKRLAEKEKEFAKAIDELEGAELRMQQRLDFALNQIKPWVRAEVAASVEKAVAAALAVRPRSWLQRLLRL
jgi:hypothetical protein